MKFAVLTLTALLALDQRLGVRLNPTSGGGGTVLTASDITFDGFIKIPSGTDYLTFPAGSMMSGRLVGGVPHLFVWGAWGTGSYQNLYEINVDPALLGSLTTSISTAPRSTLYANWGDPGHGQQQSWDGACNPLSDGPSKILAQGMYYNASTSLLYHSYQNSYVGAYEYNVMAASLDSISGTTGTTTVVGGPWRFTETSQYNSQVRHGFRSSWFQADPRNGTMLVGGKGYEDPTKAWGPNIYGGRAWPTGANGGGCNSTAIVTPNEYIDYYPYAAYPSTSPGAFNGWTGAVTGSIPTFNWDASFLTYPFQRYASGNLRANPVSGRASIGDSGASSFVGWFNGSNKSGVIFNLGLEASTDSDPTHCTTAALDAYLNSGVGVLLHFSSHTGTATGTITGGTSGATLSVIETGILATNNVLGGTQTPSVDFTSGETVTGSGFTGVLDLWHRGDTFDNPSITSGHVVGCSCTQPPALCATGPSFTFQTPVIAIYDPGSLENVKNNTSVDYLTFPTSLFSLTAAPYSLALHTTLYPFGVGGAGGWIDATNNKMYLTFQGQDTITRPDLNPQDVFARFSINDSAAPAPLPQIPAAEYGLLAMLTGVTLLRTKR